MKKYACPKMLCELYDACPLSRMIPAEEQSDPMEETGEPLYFAACPELGETFCDLREDTQVDVSDVQHDSTGDDDVRCALGMMNHLLEQAAEYLCGPIVHGVAKHGPTRWEVPREKIDSLKEAVPHQAKEIKTTLAKIARDGFEPHQFLEPGDVFMVTALAPFTEDFFAYRRRAGDRFYSDVAAVDEVNESKAKYRAAWDGLLGELDTILPAKASIIRVQNSVKGMLLLFERRLSLGVDAVSSVEYEHAVVTLKEKLCDVAADLRKLNLTRKNDAEAKRQERSAKRLAAQLGPGLQGAAKMDDEHVKRCSWIFKALEAHRCQLKSLLEDNRTKKPKLGPPTEDRITQYINVVVFRLKKNDDGNYLETERDGAAVRPITKRQVRTTLQQALGATIDDIKHIYMDWKEEQLKELHHAHITTERAFVPDKDIDLAGGEHNWGGIEDEEAEFNQTVRMTIGKPKSRWMWKSSESYNKLKKSLEDKKYRFDYRIFTYWIGLHMEAFVKIPRMMDFKAMLGTVKDVETLLESLARFIK